MTIKMNYLEKVAKILFFVLMCLFVSAAVSAKDFVWYDGSHAVTYHIQKEVDPVVKVAADMFSDDMEAVTGKKAIYANHVKEAVIRVVQLDKTSVSLKKKLLKQGVPVNELLKKTDGFSISVINNQITIVGVNGRGAAYGLLEMSRHAGVNPWVWWGDVVPEKSLYYPLMTLIKLYRELLWSIVVFLLMMRIGVCALGVVITLKKVQRAGLAGTLIRKFSNS